MRDENRTIEPGARANPLRSSFEEFGIHPERGFLPAPDPLELLPEDFSPWDKVARELPKLLITGKVRGHLMELPARMAWDQDLWVGATVQGYLFDA
jgi:hypothetical protein